MTEQELKLFVNAKNESVRTLVLLRTNGFYPEVIFKLDPTFGGPTLQEGTDYNKRTEGLLEIWKWIAERRDKKVALPW